MRAIGIDMGTTTVCGVLIDAASGDILAKAERKNDAAIASPHAYEKIQNPDRILEIATSVLEELALGEICSVGVTGQMHGIVYLDAQGNAVSPLYTWQDGRGNLPIGDTTYAARLGSSTGYGYVTHDYNRQNGLVPASAVCFCTIHDYVAMRICGEQQPLIHTTDAASFGQWDIDKGCFTVKDDMLPAVTGDNRVLGHWRGIPVGVAIGDNQASFLGAAHGAGSVLVNIGTGSQVSLVSDRPVDSADVETRPYFDGKYLLVGCSLCGGKSYALLEGFFRETLRLFRGEESSSLYDVMNRVLEQQKTTDVVVDTRFMGTRQHTDLRASVSQLTPDNFTPQHLICGLVQGMSDELYGLFDAMQAGCDVLIGSGNGVRKNPALRRLLSERFGQPMQVPRHTEEASYGAALFSLLCIGAYADVDQVQQLIQYEPE